MKKITLLITTFLLLLIGCTNDADQSVNGKSDGNVSNVEEASKKKSVEENDDLEDKPVEQKNIIVEIHGDNDIHEDINYNNKIDYIDLARYPDKYEDTAIKRVVVIMDTIPGEDYNTLIARYATYEEAKEGDEEDLVVILYNPDALKHRLMEGDELELYGVSAGITSYKLEAGKTKEAPLIVAHSIWLFID